MTDNRLCTMDDLTADEVKHIGRRRAGKADNTMSIVGRVASIMAVVFLVMTAAIRSQLLIIGIAVSIGVMMFVAVKENRRLDKAGKELLEDVKDG